MRSEAEPINPLESGETVGQEGRNKDKDRHGYEWVGEYGLELIMQLVTMVSFGILIGLVAYHEFGVSSIMELVLTPGTAFLLSGVTVCIAVVFRGSSQKG